MNNTRVLVLIVTFCAVACAVLAFAGAPVWLAAPLAVVAAASAALVTPRLLRRPS
jgi:hypothetical protein